MAELDMRGKPCPLPVIEAKKRLAALSAGESLAVLVDNDVARQNLGKLAAGGGHAFAHETGEDGVIRATITVGEGCEIVGPDSGKGFVVAIGSDVMGNGNDELGRTLMKSFIFSLTEQDPLPGHVLFFNGGVHLACEGSTALNDLAALAEKGVRIDSCGACLNFYGKTESVRIGGVTNMFAILQTMARAKRLINL